MTEKKLDKILEVIDHFSIGHCGDFACLCNDKVFRLKKEIREIITEKYEPNYDDYGNY